MPIQGPWDAEYRERYYSSPRVQEHLKKFKITVSQPKSEAQRARMSQAALGVPKSEQHRDSMSRAQLHRQELRRKIMQESPNLSSEQVWHLVREQLHE